VKGTPFFGATVGRVANRIRNARFTLEGREYRLPANDGPHHLHGGTRGWDKAVWTAVASHSDSSPQIRLTIGPMSLQGRRRDSHFASGDAGCNGRRRALTVAREGAEVVTPIDGGGVCEMARGCAQRWIRALTRQPSREALRGGPSVRQRSART